VIALRARARAVSRVGDRSALVAPALLVGAALVSVLIVAWFGNGQVDRSYAAIFGLGTVYGSLNALLAIGLILVYRSGRVINFSQAGFGTAATMLYLLLSSAWGWSWWFAIGAALLGAAAVGWLVEVFLIRRFSRSPRLVLTVVTIALAQTLAGFTLRMPRMWGFERLPDDPSGGLAGLPSVAPRTPIEDWSWEWFPVRFNGNHLLAVLTALVAMVALALFLRRSRVGVAVRGASENSNRAELLGINVHNVSSIVWVIAALLAAVAALAGAMVTGATVQSATGQSIRGTGGLAVAIGAGTLLRALAAAVIARMERIPVAVAACIAIAMFEQAVFWAFSRTNIVDVVLLAAVVAALLVQRRSMTRVDPSEATTWEATEEIRGVPAELASMPLVRNGIRRSIWVLAIVVAAYPWVMSPSQVNLGGVYAIYGIVGVSLVVLTGWAGQISLGQFGLVAVGALVGGLVTADLGLPFPVAVVLGSVAAAGAAVAIGIPALRIKGLFLAVTTLAFSVAVATWLLAFDWVPSRVGRPAFLFFDSRTDERSYYYLSVAGLALAVWVVQGLRRSRVGRVLIAMRDNERTAQAHGINLVRTRLTAFAISGMLAGFAGVLFAHHQSAVSPNAFGPEQSIQMFLMAVIGGLGSVWTVIVGAIYLGTASTVIDNAAGQLLASSFGVLVILVFYPSGLGALVFRARDAWLRRIALRNRIYVPSLMGDRLKEGEEARVPIRERLPEQGELPARYRLDSAIGEAGASQLTKLWRY